MHRLADVDNRGEDRDVRCLLVTDERPDQFDERGPNQSHHSTLRRIAFGEDRRVYIAGPVHRFDTPTGETQLPSTRLADDKAARKASPAAREEFVMRME